MTATLTISPVSHASAARSVTLGCEHGRVEAVIVAGAELEIVEVQMVLLRHHRAKRCRCTAALCRRFGVSPI